MLLSIWATYYSKIKLNIYIFNGIGGVFLVCDSFEGNIYIFMQEKGQILAQKKADVGTLWNHVNLSVNSSSYFSL